jgi:RimJ/RimL family protein N-acetyltransferase
MMVADGEVVGLCGCKGPPSESGEVEIGYGVAPSRRERGHATAAVRALLEAVGREADVRAVVALTALDNVPSQCVLLRNGFVRTGTQPDPDDGEVIVWRRDV